jgi:hypothetical protein
MHHARKRQGGLDRQIRIACLPAAGLAPGRTPTRQDDALRNCVCEASKERSNRFDAHGLHQYFDPCTKASKKLKKSINPQHISMP